jgi:outer membrane lipoprotein
MLNKLLILSLLSLMLGCASTPVFDTSQVAKSVTPARVIADPELNIEQIVLWGGTILQTRNLKDSTQIEVLAYPLNSSFRPELDKKPMGRFIVRQSGYLEPTTYEQGKYVTVLGKVREISNGKVGESSYQFPVIDAQKLKLWDAAAKKGRTSFHMGIGIRL